jgi:hypothetical protein
MDGTVLYQIVDQRQSLFINPAKVLSYPLPYFLTEELHVVRLNETHNVGYSLVSQGRKHFQ